MIAERLNQASRALWENYYPGTKPQTLKLLQGFISRRAQALESATKSTHKASESPVQKSNSQQKSPNIQNYKASVEKCPCCSENHRFYTCKKFTDTWVSRIEKILFGHWNYASIVWILVTALNNASRSIPAKHAILNTPKHSTLLHLPDAPKGAGSGSLATHQATAGITSGIVPTAMVPVEDDSSKITTCRDMIDTGSQISLISEFAVQRMTLKRQKQTLDINGIGNVSKTYRFGSVSLRLKPTSGHSVITVNAYVLPSLTQVLPEREFSIAKCFHQRSVDLADTEFNKP